MDRAEIQKRLRDFQKILRKNKIDTAFVSNMGNSDHNLSYLTGKDIDFSFLIVPKKGNSIMLVSKMEYARARRFIKASEVIKFEKPINEQIAGLIKKYRAKTVGINKNVVSLNQFRMLKKSIKKKKFIDISRLLLELRSIKSRQEIARIKKACRLSDTILKKTYANLKKFRTEEDVRRLILEEISKAGCKPAFEPLVASGRNSGLVHYLGSNVPLKKGFCFIDFGVDYRGYKSDATRTIYKGKPSIRELEFYRLLLKIQKRALGMVRPGKRCSDIDRAVRVWLGKFSENFSHGLGHGVGIQIHELPNLNFESKDILKPGMILTIEPGIYFPNRFGVRIEDTVLVTENGHQVLTRVGKDLLVF